MIVVLGKNKYNRRSEAQLYLPLPAVGKWVAAQRSSHPPCRSAFWSHAVVRTGVDRIRPGRRLTDRGVQLDSKAASEVYMQLNLSPTILVVPQLEITTVWLL